MVDQLIGKDMKGSGRGLIQGTISDSPGGTGKKTLKPSVIITNLRAVI
jgi:hypothetical protein